MDLGIGVYLQVIHIGEGAYITMCISGCYLQESPLVHRDGRRGRLTMGADAGIVLYVDAKFFTMYVQMGSGTHFHCGTVVTVFTVDGQRARPLNVECALSHPLTIRDESGFAIDCIRSYHLDLELALI